MKTLKITDATADAVRWALQDYVHVRTPVREYVDKRYAHMDEAFRNRRIGEVQSRLDRVQWFIDHAETTLEGA